jgi:hypothetical protein
MIHPEKGDLHKDTAQAVLRLFSLDASIATCRKAGLEFPSSSTKTGLDPGSQHRGQDQLFTTPASLSPRERVLREGQIHHQELEVAARP